MALFPIFLRALTLTISPREICSTCLNGLFELGNCILVLLLLLMVKYALKYAGLSIITLGALELSTNVRFVSKRR